MVSTLQNNVRRDNKNRATHAELTDERFREIAKKVISLICTRDPIEHAKIAKE